ncbi:MAG: endopeptidase La [Eubacteriales bacterium]|nr:endopeptidase La [Eubacteriales bacterium]
MTIVPVFDRIIIPNEKIYIATDYYKQVTGKQPEVGERTILLISRERDSWQELNEDGFYPIGVNGVISEVSGNGFIKVKSGDRVHVEFVGGDTAFHSEISMYRIPDSETMDPEVEKPRVDRMKGKLYEFLSSVQWGVMAKSYIQGMETVGEIASALSTWMSNTPEEKYAVLEESSPVQRMELMESMVYEYLEMAKLTGEAESAQEDENEKAYRKQAIQRQMEFLQKQLDEMDPESVSDIRRFEKKIEESGMNETAEKEARKVLNRLKQEGQNSPESGGLYDYLDFVTSLCWKKAEPEHIDLTEAEQVLEEDHFGLEKVKHRIIQQIAVMELQKKQTGSILLFVGAPGTGKTSIGRSIAQALKREYVRVSLGGVRDEADIRGHRRTYIGAMAGRIMDGIQKSGVSNPVMVLDEVDKLSSSYNGDPASALLEVLDPEQNNTFTDHYMNVPYDLSDVFFICTANSTDTIPEPLLNRMEVIQFSGYTATDKFQIAKRHLLPKAEDAMGIPADRLEISDNVIRTIISDYTQEAGVRGLKKRLDTLCRVAAVELVKKSSHPAETSGEKVEGKVNPEGSPVVTVREEDLRDYLDMRPISHDRILQKKQAGVVTGLAWTRAGGEILFIETLLTAGSGKIIITGQLGDVMKESAQIAVSLVKSMHPEKAELFEKNDIHIHVPEGAVPKDGPSAGITLTTALTSLVEDKAVSPEFAMTGEVSLRGVVTPIGGLPEKLMAAQRAGIQTVFIPKENEDDLRDVPDEVKEKLEILPVSTVREVLVRTGLQAEE